jgi:HD superfamily phosphohydrolase
MPRSGNAVLIAHTKVIRDNIHGYIALTDIERGLLAQPEFHRLHFISQNGLAFHTYPATKHTRFLHSLGAMHLAGRILVSAMRKDSPAARSLRHALSAYGAREHPWLFAESRKSLFNDALYRDLGIAGDSVLCIMFQAVRIASLIHDIGHPPFSHTVEEAMQMMTAGSGTGHHAGSGAPESPRALRKAIESLPGREGGLHERIGEYLVHDVMINGLAGELHELGSRLVDLAIQISARYELHPTLRALKGVIDGEFDCDRADYVLRDCAAAGVDFGGYDLERIIPEMTVFEEDGHWFFRPTLRALSAIEAFYEERSKLYRWIVFHHSCVRSHIALQRATIAAIHLYEGSGGFTPEEAHALAETVRPIYRLWSFSEYRLCDEAWYFSFLASLLDRVEAFIDQAETNGASPSPPLLDLRGFTQQARWRVKTMIPLWKSIDQYREFCSGVLAGMREAGIQTVADGDGARLIPVINGWLLDRLQRPMRDGGMRFVEWMERGLADRCGLRLALHLTVFKYVGEDRAASQPSRGKGVFLVGQADGDTSVGRLVPLSEVSPLPASLETVWENSIRFRAYALAWHPDAGDAIAPRAVGTALSGLLTSKEFLQEWHPLAPTSPEPPTRENDQ